MRNDTRILIITNRQQDLQDLRMVLSEHGNQPEILVARTHDGGLDMARNLHPHLCILANGMLMVEGRSFSDVLKQACPGVDIFIVEDGDLTKSAVATA